MTSILGTQSIQHPNGTSAMTVASDGLVSFGNVKSGNTPCFSATFSSPLNSQSNNNEISSPNIDQANEQNIVPSNAGQIGDQVNNSQEIDSLF